MEPMDEFEDVLPTIVDQLLQVAAGLLVVLFIVWLIIYAITVIPRHKLFKMAGYPAWQAWVPFVNVFVQAKITGRSPWLFLGLYLGLPVLTYIPFIGGVFWLLPTLLTIWMCYDLALVYGQSKHFALWFSIITGSTVNFSLSFGLWNAVKSMMASVDYGITTASALTSFFSTGPGFWVQLLQLVALILVYVLAFGSGTHYEGPYSHRKERMLMHEPWLFVPGPNQSIPVPPQPTARAYQPAQTGYGQPQGHLPASTPHQPVSHHGSGSFAQPSASIPIPVGFGGSGVQDESVPSFTPQSTASAQVAPSSASTGSPESAGSSEPAGQPEATMQDLPSNPPEVPIFGPTTHEGASKCEDEEPTLVDGAEAMAEASLESKQNGNNPDTSDADPS